MLSKVVFTFSGCPGGYIFSRIHFLEWEGVQGKSTVHPTFSPEVIAKDYHIFMQHVGGPRIWDALMREYAWADQREVKKFV